MLGIKVLLLIPQTYTFFIFEPFPYKSMQYQKQKSDTPISNINMDCQFDLHFDLQCPSIGAIRGQTQNAFDS